MRRVVAIVEGDGEVGAVPILLRRLAERAGRHDIEVQPPIRVHRDKFLRQDQEFRRMLLLAQAKAQGGTVLILLDADDDCPVTLAQEVHSKVVQWGISVRVLVVIANREYEAWFLAAAESLAGRRGLLRELSHPPGSEQIRNAKGWLSDRISQGRYHEVADQPALTAIFDMELAAQRSRSFQKLMKDLSSVFS